MACGQTSSNGAALDASAGAAGTEDADRGDPAAGGVPATAGAAAGAPTEDPTSLGEGGLGGAPAEDPNTSEPTGAAGEGAAGEPGAIGDSGGLSAPCDRKCGSNAVCDPATDSCRPLVCEPKRFSCLGTEARHCNRFGTAFDSQRDCAASGEACVDGGCRARICEPRTFSCYGAHTQQCSANGDELLDAGSCAGWGPLWHCVITEDGNAGCTDVYCLADQAVCDDFNRLMICNASGDGYLESSRNCGEHAVCRDSGCQPKVCEGDYDCVDGKVVQCKDLGLSYEVSTECAADEQCVKDAAGYVACEPKP